MEHVATKRERGQIELVKVHYYNHVHIFFTLQGHNK